MKTLLLLILLGCFTIGNAFSQACEKNPFFTENSAIEIVNYNAKGKTTGRIVYNVTELERDNGTLSAVVNSKQYNGNKKEPENEMVYRFKCVDDVYYVDLQNFLVPESMASFKDMEMTVTPSEATYPTKMLVGEQLPDASLKVEFGGAEHVGSIITVDMLNRKVESRGPITVPTGTYNAYKITSDVTTTVKTYGLGIPMRMRIVEYYTPEAGVVRSETYRGAKLLSYSEMSKVEQN